MSDDWFDEQFFHRDVGLVGLPAEAVEELATLCQEELELRVGRAIFAMFTPEQFEEFESLQNDPPAAVEWLDRVCPQRPEIVAAEMEGIVRALHKRAPEIRKRYGIWNLFDES